MKFRKKRFWDFESPVDTKRLNFNSINLIAFKKLTHYIFHISWQNIVGDFMLSVWSAESKIPSFPSLKGDKKTDVVVIGGGIAGILCAYKLKQSGVDCILLEADKVCHGVTQNTTAKITSQHGFIYDKLIKSFGEEKARKYLEVNEKAIGEYRQLAKKIPCEFENKDNYVYSTDNLRKVEKELRALERIGYKAEYVDKIPVPVEIEGAVKFKNQAQFNPLQFLSEIVKNLEIYENSKVIEVRDNKALTEHGTVTADSFIIATHFPFMNKRGAYFIKLYQERSYVLALENGPQIQGMYVDEAKKGMSFRNYKDYILIGGGDHRTGKQGGSYNELRTFAKANFPSNPEKYHWATQDCMSLDGIAYIGQYSPNTPRIYVATGFNKWGITSSMVAANVLTEQITTGKSEYTELFHPSRSIITPQLFINMGETAINLATPTQKRCPHLGCALKWNSAEHTWDCPCHGSRFTEKGKLIENPATDDLK